MHQYMKSTWNKDPNRDTMQTGWNSKSWTLVIYNPVCFAWCFFTGLISLTNTIQNKIPTKHCISNLNFTSSWLKCPPSTNAESINSINTAAKNRWNVVNAIKSAIPWKKERSAVSIAQTTYMYIVVGTCIFVRNITQKLHMRDRIEWDLNCNVKLNFLFYSTNNCNLLLSHLFWLSW